MGLNLLYLKTRFKMITVNLSKDIVTEKENLLDLGPWRLSIDRSNDL